MTCNHEKLVWFLWHKGHSSKVCWMVQTIFFKDDHNSVFDHMLLFCIVIPSRNGYYISLPPSIWAGIVTTLNGKISMTKMTLCQFWAEPLNVLILCAFCLLEVSCHIRIWQPWDHQVVKIHAKWWLSKRLRRQVERGQGSVKTVKRSHWMYILLKL